MATPGASEDVARKEQAITRMLGLKIKKRTHYNNNYVRISHVPIGYNIHLFRMAIYR